MVFKVDSNRSTNLVIVIVSRRAISDAVAAFMVDSPIISLCFPSGLKPLASGLPQTQRASIRREAQGLGRESSQRFWTFGPKCGPGPGQARPRSARAAAGSEDPRKIDSTRHTHRVGRNASWDCLSSPGLCMPLGRKWARRIEWESNGDECGPAC